MLGSARPSPFISWNLPGLKTRVALCGTLSRNGVWCGVSSIGPVVLCRPHTLLLLHVLWLPISRGLAKPSLTRSRTNVTSKVPNV